jgi:Domain of unknown function (DUF1877)
MGIVGTLKQISIETLDLLRQDPLLTELFLAAQYLPESAAWKQKTYWNGESAEKTKAGSQDKFEKFRWTDQDEKETLTNQLLDEWEIPELDLDKCWMELTFFLSGYIPGYISSSAIPELDRFKEPTPQGWLSRLFSPRQSDPTKVFLDFLVVESSEWDGLPLVNAVGAGTNIGYSTYYDSIRYLLPDEIEQVSDCLTKLSNKGFEERFCRESEKEVPCPSIDWSDSEGLLEGMTDLYSETLSYYQDATMNNRAILLYLS